MLWYAPERDGKLYCQWNGPYKVTAKINKVRYQLVAVGNGKNTVDASIQDMITFQGAAPLDAEEDKEEKCLSKVRNKDRRPGIR